MAYQKQSVTIWGKKKDKRTTGNAILIFKKTGFVMVDYNGVKYRQNYAAGQYQLTKEDLNGVITGATQKRGTIIVTRKK